jgi:hypothetical protein
MIEGSGTKEMNDQESPLTAAELQILNEIVQIAGGQGNLVPVFVLKESQRAALSDLEKKGYVMVSMGNFAVTKLAAAGQPGQLRNRSS